MASIEFEVGRRPKQERMRMNKQANAVSLSNRVQTLQKGSNDTVSVDEVQSLVDSMINSVSNIEQSATIPDDLQETLEFFEGARDALDDLKANDFVQNRIPLAKEHLDEIVTQTEQVAGAIMDAAEEIGEIASQLEGENAEKLAKISTTLFESSTFQDITGQRISKVERLFVHLNERMGMLAMAIGDTYIAPEDEIEKDGEGIAIHDEDLLNGPQLENEANSQDDIDAILAMFD